MSYHTEKKNGTWLGARAEMTTYRVSTKKDSERVTAWFWQDDCPKNGVNAGDLMLQHSTGAGDKGTLEVFDKRVIAGGTQADVTAYLAEKLS